MIVFEFATSTGEKSLIFEMFSKGNSILIENTSNKILAVYKREHWSDRILKPNELYSYPKNDSVSLNQLSSIFSDRYVISCLMKLGIGKKYVKEALFRAKIEEKKPGNELSPNEISRLQEILTNMLNSLKPIGFFDSSKQIIVDFALTHLSQYNKEVEEREYSTFSEIIEEYYSKLKAKIPKKSKKLEKLENRLKKQEEQLKLFLAEEEKYRAIGTAIYNNYDKIEELINNVRKKDKNKKIKIELEL